MIDVQEKKFLEVLLRYKAQGKIRHRDITVLLALMQKIKFDSYNDMKNKRVASITGMDKSDVSKSINRLKQVNILIEDEKEGYILNSKLEDLDQK